MRVRYDGCGENDGASLEVYFRGFMCFYFPPLWLSGAEHPRGIIGGVKRVPFFDDDVSDSELTRWYLCAMVENNCVWQ